MALALLLFAVWGRLGGGDASPLAQLAGELAFALPGGLSRLFAGRLRRGAAAPARASEAPAERTGEGGARSPEAAIGLSPQGKVLSWNPGAERMFGYAAEEVLGREVELLVPARLRERELASVAAALERGETVQLETLRRRKDGGELPVALVAAPLIGAHGGPVGAIMVLTDLSEAPARAGAVAGGERALRVGLWLGGDRDGAGRARRPLLAGQPGARAS